MHIQVGEAVQAQYVSVEDEEQLTQAPVAALQDNGNGSTCSKNGVIHFLYRNPDTTDKFYLSKIIKGSTAYGFSSVHYCLYVNMFLTIND